MSSTQWSQALTDIASDLCRECRDIPTWYSSMPKNQLIGAALVAETASRGHVGCLRAALRASHGEDLYFDGLRQIVPVPRLRVNPLAHEETRADNASLLAAGEKKGRQIIEQVPENIQRKFSLKNICRRKIREHLLDLDPHTNLCSRVPRLGLPSSLTAYVLHDISLDDVDECIDDEDDLINDVDDDVISNCSLDVAVGSDIDDYSYSDGKDVSDDDLSVDVANGGGEDIDVDSEDNDDKSNDCSLDVTIGSDYSNCARDAVFDSDNDDNCDDDYSLAVAIGSYIDDDSNDGGQDCSSDENGDDDEEDDDDDSSDGNLDVIDSYGYDSGNGSSLVIVSCDDEDNEYSNHSSLAAINSDGYDSGDSNSNSLDIVSSDDDAYSNGGSLDVVVDSDDNGDDDVNLDIVSSDDDDEDVDNDDHNSCSLVVVIDSDNDDDVANVDSLDIISNDDNTEPHRDYLNVDIPLKHLEYLDLRIKELDPHVHLFNSPSRL